MTAAAMFGPDLPLDVELSDSIHPTVREAWPEVVATIRTHLETLVDADGGSRVW